MSLDLKKYESLSYFLGNQIGKDIDEFQDDESLFEYWRKFKYGSRDYVLDSRGKRRFHGAFKGGFSAGYRSTVGSAEGWQPSTFQSDRSKRGKYREQSIDDFMDDEDRESLQLNKPVVASQFKSRQREEDSANFNLNDSENPQIEGQNSEKHFDFQKFLNYDIGLGKRILRRMKWQHMEETDTMSKTLHPSGANDIDSTSLDPSLIVSSVPVSLSISSLSLKSQLPSIRRKGPTMPPHMITKPGPKPELSVPNKKDFSKVSNSISQFSKTTNLDSCTDIVEAHHNESQTLAKKAPSFQHSSISYEDLKYLFTPKVGYCGLGYLKDFSATHLIDIDIFNDIFVTVTERSHASPRSSEVAVTKSTPSNRINVSDALSLYQSTCPSSNKVPQKSNRIDDQFRNELTADDDEIDVYTSKTDQTKYYNFLELEDGDAEEINSGSKLQFGNESAIRVHNNQGRTESSAMQMNVFVERPSRQKNSIPAVDTFFIRDIGVRESSRVNKNFSFYITDCSCHNIYISEIVYDGRHRMIEDTHYEGRKPRVEKHAEPVNLDTAKMTSEQRLRNRAALLGSTFTNSGLAPRSDDGTQQADDSNHVRSDRTTPLWSNVCRDKKNELLARLTRSSCKKKGLTFQVEGAVASSTNITREKTLFDDDDKQNRFAAFCDILESRSLSLKDLCNVDAHLIIGNSEKECKEFEKVYKQCFEGIPTSVKEKTSKAKKRILGYWQPERLLCKRLGVDYPWDNRLYPLPGSVHNKTF